MHHAVTHANSLDQIGGNGIQRGVIDCISLANFVV
jgi:hypothetical protein